MIPNAAQGQGLAVGTRSCDLQVYVITSNFVHQPFVLGFWLMARGRDPGTQYGAHPRNYIMHRPVI